MFYLALLTLGIPDSSIISQIRLIPTIFFLFPDPGVPQWPETMKALNS